MNRKINKVTTRANNDLKGQSCVGIRMALKMLKLYVSVYVINDFNG